jgi:hypothetical protein
MSFGNVTSIQMAPKSLVPLAMNHRIPLERKTCEAAQCFLELSKEHDRDLTPENLVSLVVPIL